MGSEKQQASTTTVNNSTQTPTPTPEQTRLNQLDLQLREQNQGALGQVQGNSLNLANLLLQGQNLPGYLNTLPGGIDEATTQGLVNQSLRDIQPLFQGKGLLDSGVNASISARTANDTRLGSAQFNIQNLMQLLNLATGSSAQAQQPIIGQAGMLGQRLQGLNSISQSGTSNQNSTTTSMNPFLKSFQTSAGAGASKFIFGA